MPAPHVDRDDLVTHSHGRSGPSLTVATQGSRERGGADAGGDAIAAVLSAERDARSSLDATRVEALELVAAERARAYRVTARADQRVLAIPPAFERELAARLADHAQALAATPPHEPTLDERAAVDKAVRTVARELVGVRP